MTNGEKLMQAFPDLQIDMGKLEVYMWTTTHDAIDIPLDWWNAEYKEPTTKNDLGVDCISRKQAIDAFPNLLPNIGYNKQGITEILQELPSVTPQEPILDKIFCIVHPLSIMSTPELEHKAIMQIAEMLEPLCLPESEDEG